MVDNPAVLHIQVSCFRDFAKEFFEKMSNSRFFCSMPSLLITSVRVQTVSRSFEEMEIMFGSGETDVHAEATRHKYEDDALRPEQRFKCVKEWLRSDYLGSCNKILTYVYDIRVRVLVASQWT